MLLCYLGGGSLDGGDLGSPRCLGPPTLTPEGCGAAHGPRHPAYPLLLRSLIPLWGFGSHSSWAEGSICVFAPKQRCFVRFCFALQDPTPVRCCWLFLFAVVASLFFFSPGVGKHKPRCSLWFPLCFPGRVPHLQPVHLRLPLHQGIPPAPVFFFFCRRLAVCGGFRSVLAVAGLSLSLSLSLRSCLRCMYACVNKRQGGGLPDGAPNYDDDGIDFSGKEHGTVSRTVRQELPMLPPLPPAAL